LVYRRRGERLEVLLVPPGGPLWANKDAGAWTIPKGEHAADEEPLAAALREFGEEIGCEAPAGPHVALTPIRQRSGKLVRAFACAGDCDPTRVRSNTFTLEWPPRSGKFAEFPEIDRAAFFSLAEARARINPGQVALLDELERIVS
jgi:predicted NUDIX family NTP pyrophosphohydrolase